MTFLFEIFGDQSLVKKMTFKNCYICSDMLNAIKEKYPNLHALENQPNDTSKAYKVNDFAGQIGFITSMTEHFCGSCNRLRITADGNLKVK